MSRKKKNRNQDKALQAIVLITALIQLIVAILDLIQHLSG